MLKYVRGSTIRESKRAKKDIQNLLHVHHMQNILHGMQNDKLN